MPRDWGLCVYWRRPFLRPRNCGQSLVSGYRYGRCRTVVLSERHHRILYEWLGDPRRGMCGWNNVREHVRRVRGVPSGAVAIVQAPGSDCAAKEIAAVLAHGSLASRHEFVVLARFPQAG